MKISQLIIVVIPFTGFLNLCSGIYFSFTFLVYVCTLCLLKIYDMSACTILSEEGQKIYLESGKEEVNLGNWISVRIKIINRDRISSSN